MAGSDADLDSLLAALPPQLCAACVGRTFARRDPALDNAARGRRLAPQAPSPGDACPLCEGMAARYDSLARLAMEASRDHEFDTFLVGSSYWAEIRTREDALYDRLAEDAPGLRRAPKDGEAPAPAFAWAEYLKSEINREVGKRIEAATRKRPDFSRPDLTFHVDTRLDHVTLRPASLHVRGRYRKHDRTLPQTRWPCRSCGGLGCRSCGHRGKTYESSVEELVAAPFVEATGATGESFHGMGREDIDARMLGTGRPFVLELKGPRKRRVDWGALAAEVASRSARRVEVFEAGPTDPHAPARYKAAAPAKTYVAACVAETAVDGGKLITVLPSFRGVQLDQRTPERVAHRRADLVRARRILDVRLLRHEGARIDLEIRAESGTYIKEFVSGDEGRTRPSVAEALGVGLRVAELDVVDVDWKE